MWKTTILICLIIFFVFDSKICLATYSGDLSGKFQEIETVINLPQQMYGFFTIDHRNVTQGQVFPSGASMTNGILTFNQKTGIVIQNPLASNSFYKIEVTMVDNNQTSLSAYLTILDSLWSFSSSTKGASAGIDTVNSSSTYWYEHNQLKNVGDIGWNNQVITQAQYDFSRQAMSKFTRRRLGDIKIEYYVTPIGIYPVIDGSNYNSFPDLYTGSYLMPPTTINWIVLGKWDTGANVVSFKNLKVVDLDDSVLSVDEVNAHFIKKTLESSDFLQLISNSTSGNGSNGFQNALWIAFLYRGYDYYFKTNSRDLVRKYVDYYTDNFIAYSNVQLAKYGVDSTLNVTHSFINSSQSNPFLVWGMNGYLTKIQKDRLQIEYAKIVDKIIDYTRPNDPDPKFRFPASIQYINDTFAEEVTWIMAFLTGYYVNWPNDPLRSEKILEYIKFYGFHHLSTSNDDFGESLLSVYPGISSVYLNDSLLNLKSKYIWPDGLVDNHEFHPTLNYGGGLINTAAVVRNALKKKNVVIDQVSHNLDLVYNKMINGYADNKSLRFSRFSSKWKMNPEGTVFYPLTLVYPQDDYSFDSTGYITEFSGTSYPSHLEDWGSLGLSYQIPENYGDYVKAKEVAINTYYGYYLGSGKLFCGGDLINGSYCSASSKNMYNYLYNPSLYAMLFSMNSNFNPNEPVYSSDDLSALTLKIGQSVTLSDVEDIDQNLMVNSLDMAIVLNYFSNKKLQ
jgi:hypothetical protein